MGRVRRKLHDAQESSFNAAEHFVQGVGETLQLIPSVQRLKSTTPPGGADRASGPSESVDR